MKNIKVKVVKGKLLIEVDLKKDFGPSASGKTIIVGTSEGNAEVPGHEDMRLGINVYKYATPKS